MVLNDWEQHELNLVKETLQQDDPALAARLCHPPRRRRSVRLLLDAAAAIGAVAVALGLIVGMAVGTLALSLF